MENDPLLVRRPVFFRGSPVKIIILSLLGTLLLVSAIIDTSIIAWATNGLWAFIFLARLFDLYVITRTTKIIITDQETILKDGVIFWRTKRIPHEDVSSIKVNQYGFDKAMEVGSIKITSKAKPKVKIVVDGIPEAFQIKELIESMR